MYVRKDHFQSKFSNCNGEIEYIRFIDVHYDDIEAHVHKACTYEKYIRFCICWYVCKKPHLSVLHTYVYTLLHI